MLYLWSCNQSVAWKCRHWNMLRPKIYWTKSKRNLAKFQNFEKFNIIQICTDVTVLLHSIWELLSNTLFAFTFDYMYFFQFLPLSSGRNWKKYLFSSFFHSPGNKPISSGSFRTLKYCILKIRLPACICLITSLICTSQAMTTFLKSYSCLIHAQKHVVYRSL